MKAYHFLRANMKSGAGKEPPWQIGEERTYEGPLALCASGYHSSGSWFNALRYAPGPVACVVEISEPVAWDQEKQVSRSRKLVAAANVERELRQFACDCALRALAGEKISGRELDPCLFQAVATASAFAQGEASHEELQMVREFTRRTLGSVRYAAHAAVWTTDVNVLNGAQATAWAAREAAAEVAEDAVWAIAQRKKIPTQAANEAVISATEAARAAEYEWQVAHLAKLLDARVAAT